MARLALLVLALLIAVPSLAEAQVGLGRPSVRGGGGTRTPQTAPPEGNAPTSRGGEAWPRLDVGAVFCRSLEDLQRYQAALEAQNRGEAADLPTRNCALVGTKVPVDVVERRGLGRTQVRLSQAGSAGQKGDTGWTDAWLPERQPGR